MHSHTHTLIQEQNMYKHINNIHACIRRHTKIHIYMYIDEKIVKKSKINEIKCKEIKVSK